MFKLIYIGTDHVSHTVSNGKTKYTIWYKPSVRQNKTIRKINKDISGGIGRRSDISSYIITFL